MSTPALQPKPTLRPMPDADAGHAQARLKMKRPGPYKRPANARPVWETQS